MRILLLGKDGQVGGELAARLGALGTLVAPDRSQCDLTRIDELRQLVRDTAPVVIVNAAAYTAVDRAESEPALAHAVNALAPAVLGEEAKRLGALLVHYSTDYVFDGRLARPYVEEDSPNPQSAYGRSKLAGEEALRASGAVHFIFRTSWVFGPRRQNFLLTMLRLAAEREALRVVDDQFGAPTPADWIAEATLQVLARYRHDEVLPSVLGTYHLAAGGHTSWLGFARAIVAGSLERGAKLRLTPAQIEAISTLAYGAPALRPANSRLDTGKLQRTFGLQPPPWETGLRRVLDELLAGSRHA